MTDWINKFPQLKKLDEVIAKTDRHLIIAQRKSEEMLNEMKQCLANLKEHKDTNKLMTIRSVFEKCIAVLSDSNTKECKDTRNYVLQYHLTRRRTASSDGPPSEVSIDEPQKPKDKKTFSTGKKNFIYGKKKPVNVNLFKVSLSCEEQKKVDALVAGNLNDLPHNVFSLSATDMHKAKELEMALSEASKITPPPKELEIDERPAYEIDPAYVLNP